MSGYVLFGGIVGLALGEWAGVTSAPVACSGSASRDHRRRQPGGPGAGLIGPQENLAVLSLSPFFRTHFLRFVRLLDITGGEL